MWPFRKQVDAYSDVRMRLEVLLLPVLRDMMQLKPADAKVAFTEMFERVRKAAEVEGTINCPCDFGDYLLRNERTDAGVGAHLAAKRADGVTDADIRSFWNQHDLDRRMMVALDEVIELAHFMKLRKTDGMSNEMALLWLKRHRPWYGDSGNSAVEAGENRPLPKELRDRINGFMSKFNSFEMEELRQRVEQASSFNAFVRGEIRAGRL